MAEITTQDDDTGARLYAMLGAFYDAQERGEAPSVAALRAAHPDLSEALAEHFAGDDFLLGFARGLGANDAVKDFGEYEDIRELGRGGMGVVYAARHRRLGRVVALKMIRTGVPQTSAEIQRHHAEAAIIASLEHPNIIPIYDYGLRDDQPYSAMKLVVGGSLADHLPRFREDPRASARLLATIAGAIDYAHENNVLHRDLKPQNILIEGEDHPFVADFGIAKKVAPDSTTTVPGNPVGTPSYMSPEQASGRNGASSAASDIYGLGAVLYAMLTGGPPFKGGSVPEIL